MSKKRLKKKAKREMPMSSYITMPHYSHYFPVQMEIIRRMKTKRGQKKKK